MNQGKTGGSEGGWPLDNAGIHLLSQIPLRCSEEHGNTSISSRYTNREQHWLQRVTYKMGLKKNSPFVLKMNKYIPPGEVKTKRIQNSERKGRHGRSLALGGDIWATAHLCSVYPGLSSHHEARASVPFSLSHLYGQTGAATKTGSRLLQQIRKMLS